nr:MAG TPA: hypothetical protein [Caudoviricetes sp.]
MGIFSIVAYFQISIRKSTYLGRCFFIGYKFMVI